MIDSYEFHDRSIDRLFHDRIDRATIFDSLMHMQMMMGGNRQSLLSRPHDKVISLSPSVVQESHAPYPFPISIWNPFSKTSSQYLTKRNGLFVSYRIASGFLCILQVNWARDDSIENAPAAHKARQIGLGSAADRSLSWGRGLIYSSNHFSTILHKFETKDVFTTNNQAAEPSWLPTSQSAGEERREERIQERERGRETSWKAISRKRFNEV